MKLSTAIVIFCIGVLTGCQWDPPHENPLDPASQDPRSPYGHLRVLARSFDTKPISRATVVIPELGRIGKTDVLGYAEFYDLADGNWFVVAYRDSGEAIYAPDTILAEISFKRTTEITMTLDALPRFNSAYAVSVAFSDSVTQSVPDYYIRLRATVSDPDGATDLVSGVEATLVDTLRNYTHNINLEYDSNPDSSFWWALVPASRFHNNSTDAALFLPFTFRATDTRGNASLPRTAFVARILHGVPLLQSTVPEWFPHLQWTYPSYSELTDTSAFNYVVTIYRKNTERTKLYTRTIVPRKSPSGTHVVEEPLQQGEYAWEVLVLDNFGNSTRSARINLVVGPPI